MNIKFKNCIFEKNIGKNIEENENNTNTYFLIFIYMFLLYKSLSFLYNIERFHDKYQILSYKKNLIYIKKKM